VLLGVVLGIRQGIPPGLQNALIATGLVLVFVVVEVPGRPYYTDGLMPVVFAAGAVSVEEGRRRMRRWIAAPLVWGLVSLPLVLPVLPVSVVGELPFLHKLNYDLGETIGWPQLTSTVARVYRSLPPAVRARTSIFTSNYGEAGALLVYGGRYHLPPAISGHNTFWLWGPDHQPDGAVIAFGAAGQLRPYFRSCTPATTFHSPHGVNNDENGTVISICAHGRGPWQAFWSRLRHYD